MDRFLKLVLLMLCAIPAGAQSLVSGSPVQNNSGATAVTSLTCVLGTTLAAGDTIVVYGWNGNNTGLTMTASDNDGNTYTVDRAENLATDGDSQAVLHADNISVSTNNPPTVTVSTASSASGSMRCIAAAFSGLTTSSKDQVNGSDTSCSSCTSGNVTPSQANELVIGAIGTSSASGSPISTGSGFTNLEIVTVSSANRNAMEYQIISSTSPLAATYGLNASIEAGTIVVTYKATAAAASSCTAMLTLLKAGC